VIKLLEASLNWPVFPVTVLLGICLLYWLCVIVGVLDLDLLDFDLDFEIGGEAPSILDFGFVGLRFFNLGEVPIMLWLSFFSISLWMLAINLDAGKTDQTFMEYLPFALRNLGISLVVTKLITQPFRGAFRYLPPNEVETLLDQTCQVTSTSVSDKFGQAEFQTEGAPLKLHIRSEDHTIQKGDLVRLTDYNPEKQVFYVVKINQES